MSSQLVGKRRPVEVLLVQHDLADQARVGVHAHAEHQPAGLGIFGVAENRQIAQADRPGCRE